MRTRWARFNREGLQAMQLRPGGRHKKVYTEAACEGILQEFARTPLPATEGTATWSLLTWQKALRQAPDGLPKVSTYTLWQALREAGNRPQQSRSWCETGREQRKREEGVVTVTDPDIQAKKVVTIEPFSFLSLFGRFWQK